MRRGRLILYPGIIVLLALAAYAALPQTKGGARTAPATEPSQTAASGKPKGDRPKRQVWNIEYEELVHNDASGEGEAKKVVATSEEETIIRSDLFRWNEKKKEAKATGNLQMSDPQADATATTADIFYAKAKKLIVLTGNVRIVLKPKRKETEDTTTGSAPPTAQGGKAAAQPKESAEDETTGSARRFPIDITCDKVEYQYAKEKKQAILTGNFRAVQKVDGVTRTITAAYAEWFGNEDRVLLHGPVRFEDTKGRITETKVDVTIFTKEGNERLSVPGPGTAQFPAEEEEEEQKTAPPPKKP